jgi:hypothetical protein
MVFKPINPSNASINVNTPPGIVSKPPSKGGRGMLVRKVDNTKNKGILLDSNWSSSS